MFDILTLLVSSLPEGLGEHPDGSLLLLGALDQVGAHLLEGLDVPRGEGDADTMDGGFLAAGGLGVLVSRLKQDIISFKCHLKICRH